MSASDFERDSSFTSFDIPSDRGAVREIRRRVLEFARQLPFPKGDLNSIEIAVGEAAVNAVRYGSPLGQIDRLHVTCEFQGDLLTIEIIDQGAGFMPSAVPCPVAEDLKSSGYGLCLMSGLMDDVYFDSSPEGGTSVRMSKRAPSLT
jgi:anti-sigma regulatory factor (Ser/Thr protein kinase)